MTDAGLIVELLAKSSVIAGAGLVLAAALSARPAVERVDVLRAAVCILLGLPVIMALAPGLELALLPAAAAEVAPSTPVWQGAVGPVAGLSVSGTIRPLSLIDIMIGAWVIGAVAVFGRFVLGVLTLRRWTRSGRPVTEAAWTAPLEYLPRRGRPRVIGSQAVESPLSWGLAPGVVLIGETCLAKPQTAAAVMAHELAHIRRGDWLFLALSRLALAVFWFNPLVWLLHATLVGRTEDAADAAAIVAMDRRTYARALVGLAADFRQPAAVGMAGDAQSLTRRIDRIMNARPATARRPVVMALTIGALIAIATPIAAVEITQVPPPPPPSAPPPPPAPPAPPAPP
ncbi:MAG: M56 family metallopeptidase, partial [Brevundimonas sp.]|uniref:M56 family metallopeptidase n=1 Tax=Brevundimonas sp. TaxID=1871086 RepID=UPI003918B5A9